MIIKPIIPIWLMAIICVAIVFLLKRNKKSAFVRQIVMVVLLFITNLGMMIPSGEMETKVANLDAHVIFVVDNTISMYAMDYDGKKERMHGVIETCEHIVDELSGARFAVISFDNDAKVLSPFSASTFHTKNIISSIVEPARIYAQGTSLDVSVKTLERTLKRIVEKGNTNTAVFFITDGEITGQGKLGTFSNVAKYIKSGAVLGYGTKEGGKMYAYSSYYNDGEEKEIMQVYNDNYELVDALSIIDEDNLNQIASQMGLPYIHVEKISDVDGMIKTILKNANSEPDVINTEGYKRIHYYFVIPILLLLIYELVCLRKNSTKIVYGESK